MRAIRCAEEYGPHCGPLAFVLVTGVRNVALMLERVAIGAQYFKILRYVVIVVAIFVMDSEYLRVRIVTAAFAAY